MGPFDRERLPQPGRARAFELAEENRILVDGDGNRFDAATGASLDGGAALEGVEDAELFWFAWLDHHPETFVHTANGTQRVSGHEPPDPTPGPGLAGLAAATAAALAATAVTRRLRRT